MVCRLTQRSKANSNILDFVSSCSNRNCACRTWKGSSLLCLVLLKPLLEYCIRFWALGSPWKTHRQIGELSKES